MDKTIRENAEKILKELSREEKARLLTGVGSWRTYDAKGKSVALFMSDGPHGLRKQEMEDYADINHSSIATCFPCEAAIACSWDEEAVAQMGAGIAREAQAEDVDIVLGCGVNIKRSPLCGRNFEYFSEDPYLTGVMASSYIESMEAAGTGACIKHFACNNQETRRQSSNSIVDERTLNEIYLRAFEMAVTKAKPSAIMSSYNRINGEYASRSRWLLKDLLRDKWGFEGSVISDWGGCMGMVPSIKAGLNIEMPDSYGHHTNEVLKALDDGTLTDAELDRAAMNILETELRLAARRKKGVLADYDAQHQLARELAERSAVLLQHHNALPLRKHEKILVIGALAENMRFQGGGSSHITTRETKNVIDALKELGYDVTYVNGYSELNEERDLQKERDALHTLKEAFDKIIYFCGLTEMAESEGYDRTNLYLPGNQLKLLDRIVDALGYAANEKVILVTCSGAPMYIPHKEHVSDILHMYLGGQAMGEALANLLTGRVNPSGKLAETWPINAEDTPCHGHFGQNNWQISDELPVGRKNDVVYKEGVFVGYRYYETYNIPVQYPFGFGLSYTTFRYSNISINNDLELEFEIENIGSVHGSETAQVYVRNTSGPSRPSVELRGFKKVSLEPGETKQVHLKLSERDFSIYDKEKHQFVTVAGDYTVQVGSSVHAPKLSVNVNIKGANPQELGLDRFYDFAYEYGRNIEYSQGDAREMTVLDTFEDVTPRSALGRLVRFAIKLALPKVISGGKDSQEYKMLSVAINESPLDSLVSTSNGMVGTNITEALVLAANGHSWRAMARLIHK